MLLCKRLNSFHEICKVPFLLSRHIHDKRSACVKLSEVRGKVEAKMDIRIFNCAHLTFIHSRTVRGQALSSPPVVFITHLISGGIK